jgi:hypothetical protein
MTFDLLDYLSAKISLINKASTPIFHRNFYSSHLCGRARKVLLYSLLSLGSHAHLLKKDLCGCFCFLGLYVAATRVFLCQVTWISRQFSINANVLR